MDSRRKCSSRNDDQDSRQKDERATEGVLRHDLKSVERPISGAKFESVIL